jgi:hypothetical protein
MQSTGSKELITQGFFGINEEKALTGKRKGNWTPLLKRAGSHQVGLASVKAEGAERRDRVELDCDELHHGVFDPT